MTKTAITDFEHRINGFALDPWKVRIIGYDTDHRDEHPLYDARVLRLPKEDKDLCPEDEALVRDIMEVGVQQAVALRKDGSEFVDCVYGRRRTVCNRFANARLIKAGKEPKWLPAKAPQKITDAEVIGFVVGENELRLDDTFQVRAEKARQMRQQGYSREKIGQKFGKPASYVDSLLAYFDLAPEVAKEVDAGRLAPKVAQALASSPREVQVKKLAAAQAAAKEEGKEAVSGRHLENVKRRAEGKDDVLSKATMRKMLAHPDAGNLPADLTRGWRIATGELDMRSVAGLLAIYRDVTGQGGDPK